MLDAARQAIRWSIPGWLLCLFVLGFLIIDMIFSGQAFLEPNTEPSNTFLLVSGLLTPHILLATGVAGMPIGFLLYQLYYAMYWRAPLFLREWPRDKGFWILRGIDTDYQRLFQEPPPFRTSFYDDEDDREPFRFTVRWRAFWANPLDRNSFLELLGLTTRDAAFRYRQNWWLEESLWYRIILDNDAGLLETRATFMADVYHSLGAAFIALWAGVVMYVGLFFHTGGLSSRPLPSWIIGATLILILVLLLSWVLRSTRRTTRWNLLTLKRHGILSFTRFPTPTTDKEVKELPKQGGSS